MFVLFIKRLIDFVFRFNSVLMNLLLTDGSLDSCNYMSGIRLVVIRTDSFTSCNAPTFPSSKKYYFSGLIVR